MPPPILTLSAAAVYADSTPLFDGVDLALERGDRLCLIGRNGSGKSTLLRVMAGRVELDRGERFLQPGTTVGLLDQDLMRRPEGSVGDFVRAGLRAGAPDHVAEAALDRIGLDPGRAMASLSGGEQRRAHLARTLAESPDILLLDEPTNHLDVRAIEWLEGVVAGYRGAVVIVSHDRAFLRNVTRSMLWLDRGVVRRRDAGFAAFEAWADEVVEADAKDTDRIERRIAEEWRYMERGVTARRRRNRRRVEALAKLRSERAEKRRTAVKLASFGLDAGQSKSELVIRAEHLAKRYGERAIVTDFSTRVLRGDRIGVVGPNGAGKTTLIRMLTGALAPDSGTVRLADGIAITYFDQQRERLDPDATPWQVLQPGGGDRVMVRGQSRHIVAYLRDFLFADSQARQPVRTLSGGERSRLLLARLFTQAADLLVMDEPTNDLDMETLDLLQELLADFPGTLIVVSHDRDFLDRLVTATLALEGDGTVVEYPGGYSDYLRQRPGRDEAGAARPTRKPAASAAPRASTRTRLSYKDQRELDLLPERIAGLEAEVARLEAALADQGLFARDPAAFHKAVADLDRARTALAAAEHRWLELEEQREALQRG